MKILFVSYAYPPISSPGAMRIAHFAKDLAAKGHNITVLTSANGYSSMQSTNIDSRFFGGGIDVVRARDMINKNIVKKDKSDGKKGLISILKSAVVRVANVLVFPDRDITWFASARKAIKSTNSHFDIVVGSYPTATNLMLAKGLAQYYKAKLVVDMRDLWTQDHNFLKKGIVRRFLERHLERDIFEKASLITSVSRFNSDLLSKHSRKSVNTIYNGFDTDILSAIKQNAIGNKKFVLAYAGSFYNGERDPINLLHAINKLKADGVITSETFKFDIYGNIESFLKDMVKELALEDLVNFRGLCEQKSLLAELSTANLLLTITRKQYISRGEMTTKIFEYLALDVPNLCLTKKDFEIAEFLADIPHADIADVDDPQEITDVLLSRFTEWQNHGGSSISFDSSVLSRCAASERLEKCLLRL